MPLHNLDNHSTLWWGLLRIPARGSLGREASRLLAAFTIVDVQLQKQEQRGQAHTEASRVGGATFTIVDVQPQK